MFNSLNFEVQFREPRNGHSGHYKDSHTFTEGMTIIHGPNEAGKSMRSEMLRFGLWGRKALRSKVSGYVKLNVQVEFTLKGVDYKVVRSKSNSHLTQAGKDYATGTSPVNEAIEALFGYDMEVFDLANAVLQGEVEQLGKMKPAQRKSLVDNLIGLGAIDDMIKLLSDERRLDKQTLATLKDVLVEPIKPLMVQELSDEEMIGFPALKKDILRARAIDNELAGLKVTVPQAPAVPNDTVCQWAAQWPEMEQLRRAARSAAVYAKSLEAVRDTGYTPEQLSELYTQALNYEACEDVTCPACDLDFNPSGVDKPEFSSQQVSKMRQQQATYEKYQEAQLMSDTAQDALLKFLEPDLLDSAHAEVKAFQQAQQVYEAQMVSLSRTNNRIDALEKERFNLSKYSGDFDLYEKSYNSSLTAMQLMVQYTKYKAAYDGQKTKVDMLEAKIEDYDNAIIGLRTLKVSIKSYLVPSLNKVASAYLAQMTDGARSSIVISEEFEIKVDNQPMEALSGSAKAVANLAIRLALGQTLTNSVFSVLMADEIDASMDTQRAEYTAKCLRNLTGKIKQIIIISHKKLDADNYVELT